MKQASAYAAAGVDIDEKMAALKSVKRMIGSASVPSVIGGVGHFGGMFAAPGREYALVASADGVGTKLKVAAMAGRHDTIGEDIVNHCVNDILVLGAKPLFFLDYIGTSHIDARVIKQVVSGLCRGCRRNGCALLGGETAEMPGLYPPGEYDLVGTIVGAVRRNEIVMGKEIRPGDAMIGLASSGLHTNGYSLARKVVFDEAGLDINDELPGANASVGKALLAVHRSYLRPVNALMRKVKIRGMVHITGGGFNDNIARVLPKTVRAAVDARAWRVPGLFRFLAEKGGVSTPEMYRVFNMGIGFIVIVRGRDAERSIEALRAAGEKPRAIGAIEKGRGEVRIEF